MEKRVRRVRFRASERSVKKNNLLIWGIIILAIILVGLLIFSLVKKDVRLSEPHFPFESLRMFYMFDNNMLDISGNNYNANAFGETTVSYVPHDDGTAINLEEGTYLIFLRSEEEQITNNLSISLWFNADNVTEKRVLLSQGRDYYGSGWNLYVEDGKLKFTVNTDNNYNVKTTPPTGNGMEVVVSSMAPINPGQWYHVVATYDKDSRAYLYVNTILTIPISYSDYENAAGPIVYIQEQDLENNITLGTLSFDRGKWGNFDGKIDNVAVFNTILSEADAKFLFGSIECTTDADCETGERCVENLCVVPPSPCTTDADCETGERCVENLCVIPSLPERTCVDSDGGSDLYTKGVTGDFKLVENLNETESRVVAVAGKSYAVRVDSLSSSNVKLHLNEIVTPLLLEGEFREINENLSVYIQKIDYEAYIGGIKRITFYIGDFAVDECAVSGNILKEFTCTGFNTFISKENICGTECEAGACKLPADRGRNCRGLNNPNKFVSPKTREKKTNGEVWYCDSLTLEYVNAKANNQVCTNDYECESNVCIDGLCTSLRDKLSLIEEIWCWIQGIIPGGETREACRTRYGLTTSA